MSLTLGFPSGPVSLESRRDGQEASQVKNHVAMNKAVSLFHKFECEPLAVSNRT